MKILLILVIVGTSIYLIRSGKISDVIATILGIAVGALWNS